MINRMLRLLGGAPKRWAKRLLALASSRLRALLIGSIVVVGMLLLALIYQGLAGSGYGSEQTTRLFSAYHKNWLIGLAFFSAAAAGYTYWALQVIAEDSPEQLRRRLESVSEVAFLGAVGWVIIALLLWNVGLLRAISGMS
jgi:hypothetical protein